MTEKDEKIKNKNCLKDSISKSLLNQIFDKRRRMEEMNMKNRAEFLRSNGFKFSGDHVCNIQCAKCNKSYNKKNMNKNIFK